MRPVNVSSVAFARRNRPQNLLQLGALAGLAGGVAEIAWIVGYGALSGVDPAEVARGVLAAVWTGAIAPSGLAIAAGVLIHLLLAAALGIVLALSSRPLSARFGGWLSDYGLALVVLALVWKINFFLMLPLLSPAFVHLLPYSVTLVSKLTFGLAAATVLRLRGGTARMRMW